MSQEQDDEKKITVTWDDLQTRKVEQRLKEQDALARNRVYASMDETAVTTPEVRGGGSAAMLWRNSIFALTFFGFLGGMLAWGCGTLLEFKADLQSDSIERMVGVKRLADLYEQDVKGAGSEGARSSESDSDFALTHAIQTDASENAYFAAAIPKEEADIRKRQLYAIQHAKEAGTLSPEKAKEATDRVSANVKNNPYFVLFADPLMKEAEKDQKLADLNARRDQDLAQITARDTNKALISNVLAFGVRGVIIAVLLAIALPLTESNLPAVIINGAVGAALGLIGGVAAAFATKWIDATADGSPADSAQKFLATVASWGAMGLFLTLAPGIVMRNGKKLAIGLTGGLIGGLIGGLLYEPIKSIGWLSGYPRVPELVAMLAIGLLAGLATGLIEDVAKTGWVKVVQGLIAGKQFILYRNPTFIGAGPDCQIYLFKDPKVGKRHAAIHIVSGGYELEDLPLGIETLVNGKAVKRARLKNGDRVQIGGTQLVFMEKSQAAA